MRTNWFLRRVSFFLKRRLRPESQVQNWDLNTAGAPTHYFFVQDFSWVRRAFPAFLSCVEGQLELGRSQGQTSDTGVQTSWPWSGIHIWHRQQLGLKNSFPDSLTQGKSLAAVDFKGECKIHWNLATSVCKCSQITCTGLCCVALWEFFQNKNVFSIWKFRGNHRYK